MTLYPTLEDALEVHRRLIERFGGSAGIRDLAALESALQRPQSGYYDDLIDEAAAHWESLSQNHPFVDGNKRVAVTIAVSFLHVNGYRLSFSDSEAFSFMSSLYEAGTFERGRLAAWLRSVTSRAP